MLRILISLQNVLLLKVLKNLAIFNIIFVLYLILKNLYRLYNDNLNNPSLNKLSIKKQIIHSQMILKIKKTKLKKGRVKFSFHSLFYGNFLLRQYFEIELVGETKKQEIRDFLNNELNPKK